jgi:tetratricopeptide (TPR) repeat protein
MTKGYSGISRRNLLTGGAAASVLVATEPIAHRRYGIIQKLYHLLTNPRGGTDRLVENQDGLEGKIGYAHAQEPDTVNAFPKTNSADYDGLATWAKSLDGTKDHPRIIDRLKPHEDNPDNKSAAFYNILGNAYIEGQKYQDAERVYLKAVELKPNDGNIRVNLGYLYIKQLGKREEGIKHIQYVVKNIDPNHKLATFFLRKIEKGEL